MTTLDTLALRAALRGDRRALRALDQLARNDCPDCGSADVEEGARGSFRCVACDHRWDAK